MSSILQTRRFLVSLALLFCFFASSADARTMTLPDGEVLQDPTRPPVQARVASVKQQDLQLSYILNSQARRYAIINGRKLTEGDSISGVRVARISTDSVQVVENGRTRTLSLETAASFKKKY